jgi:TonB family protein
MKYIWPLIAVSFIAVTSALAQDSLQRTHAGSLADVNLSVPFVVTRENLLDAKLKSKTLYALLAKAPADKKARLKLAQCLEAMGAYSENMHDYINSWKYYDGAANTLSYPVEKAWENRAEHDAKKAANNHQLRLDYIKSLNLAGLVLTTCNLHNYKNADIKYSSDYMNEVGLPISRNWSFVEKNLGIRLPPVPRPELVVAFNVYTDGTVGDIRLVNSCGKSEADAAAVQAVKDAGRALPLFPWMGRVVAFRSQFVK